MQINLPSLAHNLEVESNETFLLVGCFQMRVTKEIEVNGYQRKEKFKLATSEEIAIDRQ